MEIAFHDLKCWTSLRGWVPDKILFADLPAMALRKDLIRKGMACQVQYVTGDEMRRFPSRVEDVVLSDPPLIVLGYPGEVRRQRLRTELRLSTFFRGMIRACGGEATRATVVNLSRGGCLIETDGVVPAPGSQVTLGAILPNHLPFANVACVVRRVQPPAQAGLSFGALSEDQERVLEQYLRGPARRGSRHRPDEGDRRGIVGDLAALPLLDLAHLVVASTRGYLLDVWEEPRTGRLFFDGGLLLHASVGALRGTPAFLELLRWKRGQFFLSVPGESPHRNVSCGWEEVLRQVSTAA